LFRLGYNTNGLAHHRVVDALELLADLGYEGVAITPDVGELDLYHLQPELVGEIRRRASDRGLALVVETGARYLLDPRKKHHPTLLDDDSAQRARRVDMLRRSIDLAVALSAEVVSLWSGAAPTEIAADARDTAPARTRNTGNGTRNTGASTRDAQLAPLWDRLCSGLAIVLDHARSSGVRIAFEPEPGMFIERPSGYAELARRLGTHGADLGLCLDVGHLVVTGDLPVGEHVREHAAHLLHVHLDDCRAGVHEHLMFGRGDLELRDVLRSLIDAGYAGMAAVELSRDSHRGAQAAAEALEHLRHAMVDGA
jgi:sugar phosphate isomerase/epimerase